MNTAKATDKGENPNPATALIDPKINIKVIKLKMIMCPATMLAKRRTINAKGFVNTPNNSTGSIINNLTTTGTPGYQNICPQKCLLVLNKITKNEITPNTTVKAMFPVTLAEPGNKPNKLLIKIKIFNIKKIILIINLEKKKILAILFVF